MSRTWARAVTGACSALVVAAATLVIGGAPAASAADGCSAEYTVASDWGSGFVGNVTVTNTSGTPATGWTVQWTLPSGHTITNTWNAELSVNGSTVTATNASWNGSLPVGGSASFGFQGTGSGASSLPTDIACFLDAPGGGTPGGPNEPGGPDEPGGPGTPANAVRIMPLGDSITGSPGCWRALLWQDLTDAGYTNIDFVGTLPPAGLRLPLRRRKRGPRRLAGHQRRQPEPAARLAVRHPPRHRAHALRHQRRLEQHRRPRRSSTPTPRWSARCGPTTRT